MTAATDRFIIDIHAAKCRGWLWVLVLDEMLAALATVNQFLTHCPCPRLPGNTLPTPQLSTALSSECYTPGLTQVFLTVPWWILFASLFVRDSTVSISCLVSLSQQHTQLPTDIQQEVVSDLKSWWPVAKRFLSHLCCLSPKLGLCHPHSCLIDQLLVWNSTSHSVTENESSKL